MKRLILFNIFLFLFVIGLHGCHITARLNHPDKVSQSRLETILIEDIRDGGLDTPFIQACLIASDVDTDKKMRKYMDKINNLIFRLNYETDAKSVNNPITKATIIFDWLQKNANDGTYKDCYDIKDTLNINVGNCLSYAIRFTILCRYYDVDIKTIFVPGHVYNMIEYEGQKKYFEHTHSDGIVKSGDLNNPQRKILNDIEVIAEIFIYKAKNYNTEMKYEKSLKYCQMALLCSPDDNRPVVLLIDNYIAEKRYNEAFQYLDTYLERHPDDRISFKNTYVILQKLCKKGDTRF